MNPIDLISSLAIGYFLGAIPFGLLLAKLAGLGDIRNIGSGNIGTTNVLRTGRKDIAALTLLLDVLKAGGAGWLAASLFGSPFGYVAAAAALIGHCYPVWLKFKGGKGVATFFGALIILVWPVGLAAAAIWIGMAFLKRYSSLAALTAAAFAPIISFFIASLPATLMALFMGLVIYWRHRENIGRLRRGEESKIGQKG